MVIRSIAPNDSIERYTALGVEVLAGKATLINPWTVEVALNSGQTQRLTTRSIVIAACAQPVVPDVPGMADAGYVTTDTLWATLAGMDAIPQRIVLLGGGPIGCELAQSLARLGAAVTLVKAAPRLLLREDEDVSAHAEQVLTKEGVLVLTGHKALRCTSAPKAKSIVVTSGGVEQSLPFDLLICAVGRLARLTGYGMETLGISTGRTVQVNGYLQTQYPHIYVAGDAAGPHQFTHMAAHQAWYAVRVAVVGGGAGGVELLLAMQHRLTRELLARGVSKSAAQALLRFDLLTQSPTIMPTHSEGVQQRFSRVLARRGVAVHSHAEVVTVRDGQVVTRGGLALDVDVCFWVTQAGAAPWLQQTGLALDAKGFIQVNDHLQSVNDPRIFAAGDTAAMTSYPLEKAGVVAVRQARSLAANLG